jgi:septum formation protein
MLVLASNSPRRKQLLTVTGWDFHVVVPSIDEAVRAGEQPGEYVRRVAVSKALAVLDGPHFGLPDDAVILAADTAVVDSLFWQADEGSEQNELEILGKPTSPEEAEAMLRRLRGRIHQVYTGFAVVRARDRLLLSEVVVTDVPMREFSEAEIRAYIATGDPFDKAGAYAIQHPAFRPVQNLQGCYANVMGLPVCQVARLLGQIGLVPPNDFAGKCQWALDYHCEIYQRALADGNLWPSASQN